MNKDFVCQRCGQCCIRGKPDAWILYKSDFTLTEKWLLINRRFAENPKYTSKDRCEMLIQDGDYLICLIEKIYGKNRKPIICKEYPTGETCFRMQKGKLNERNSI